MQKMRWEPLLEAGLMTWYRPRDNVDDGRVVAKFRLRAAMRDGLANVHAELEPRDAVGPMAGGFLWYHDIADDPQLFC